VKRPEKPLGQKAYGHIGHLPGSRRGPGDHGVPEGQGRICTEKARDKHDVIIVQEKLDGTNVAVANIDGAMVPLIRAGYRADNSNYLQHRMFANWVHGRWPVFDFLQPGERVAGEWLAQAHGTRYELWHEPFVVIDIMRMPHERSVFDEVIRRIGDRLPLPTELHRGGPLSIAVALDMLGEHGHHGAIDPAEGCVWRVERKGEVDFLAKYVRPDKVDGKYLPELSGGDAVWNWQPEDAPP
jgi:hypothetical protein